MQYLRDVFAERMSVSFELFPPKDHQPIEPVIETLGELNKFKPDFVSVTYGAGGTNKGRNVEMCEAIVNSGTAAVSHLTCIGSTREYILDLLKELKSKGIYHILALRGDLPAGWEGTRGDFSYAVELVEFIKRNDPDFMIAAAIDPEMHVAAKSMNHDIMYARRKMDAGAEMFMTQLFYDNEAFYRYRDMLYTAGATLPIDVGVMPVLKKEATIKMTLSNGSSIPADLARIIGKYGDDPEGYRNAGIEYTVNQIADLVSHGVDGIHLYALNKYEDVSQIVRDAGLCNAALI